MARIKGSVGSQTSKKILEESTHLIAEFGYAAVTMRMISDAVGLQVGSLYNHFENKQQLLLTIMKVHMEGLLSGWEQIDLSNCTHKERLEKFIRFHMSFNIARSPAVFISFMELRSLEPENHKLIEKMRRTYESIIREIIADGMKEGVFNAEDAHVAAMSAFGSMLGVNTWYREEGRLSLQEIEDYYVALILRSVGYTKN